MGRVSLGTLGIIRTMPGARVLIGASVVFAFGLIAVIAGMDRYADAYAWVAHTSDVRLVIGRALGHAGHSRSCDGLHQDLAAFAELTADNPVQQDRIPALRGSVDLACADHATPDLIDQLVALDATERSLMTERRDRLAGVQRWTLAAFVLSAIGAVAAIVIAQLLQRRTIRALADSEQRFRLLAASSRDLIRVHDAAGRPTYVSPSSERLLGYTPSELLALTPLSLGHPDDLERMRASLAHVQQPHAPGTTLVYRLRTKAGAYRWCETHTEPIRDDAGNLLRFYTTARDVTDRIELERKLELAAITDELTGLLNRRGFLLIAGQELRIAVRQKQGLAIVAADLDGLKRINDSLGHEHGDRAIRDVAQILRTTLRESDVIARLGGDEFVALAYDVDAERIAVVTERVRFALERAPSVGTYPLSLSIGVALLEPRSSRSLDDLMAEADQAMYVNKRARKATPSAPP